MKRLLTLLLALGLLGSIGPVMAAEPEQTASIPQWAAGMVADGYALGLFGDEIYTDYSQTVTQEQMDKMAKVVADKLALLGAANSDINSSLVVDATRGGVLNALYQEAAAYAFEGVDAGPTVGAGHMIGDTGVVQGLKDLGYAVEAMPLP